MKRAIAAGAGSDAMPGSQTLACESALHLLERSIAYGHRRLAIVRLSIAVSAGADIADPQWRYCREAADASRDPALQSLFLRAATARLAETATSHGAHLP